MFLALPGEKTHGIHHASEALRAGATAIVLEGGDVSAEIRQVLAEVELAVRAAGASLISPFVGRLDDINEDGMIVIQDLAEIFANYEGLDHCEILAASIRTANHVTQCALIGADVMTAPPAVIKGLASHVLTDKGLEQFMKDWAKTGQKIL